MVEVADELVATARPSSLVALALSLSARHIDYVCLLAYLSSLTARREVSYCHVMDDEKRRQIVAAAIKVFWKHGFRRVNMKEIAEAAGISRPGLYLYFRTKEAVFKAAITQWGDTLLEEIERGIGRKKTAREKLLFVFDVWVVRRFADYLSAPESRELTDSGVEFARDALSESYGKFERVIASVLEQNLGGKRTRFPSPERTAHVIVSGVRGFKLVAQSPAELRRMVEDLTTIVLGSA
jgi:AcrR family transcriptional regulator